MSTTTQIQEVRESAPVEAYKLGLYESAQDYITRMQGIDPATGEKLLDAEGTLLELLFRLHKLSRVSQQSKFQQAT